MNRKHVQQHSGKGGSRGREKLRGFSALVTSGPTHEPIDPVRFIGNRSSGMQGHAIAAALAKAGAEVTLVSGPVALAAPKDVRVVRVTTAREMLAACTAALPVDIAVCAAAVADWRVKKPSARKLKKQGAAPVLELVENPDILKIISHHMQRPGLVIGFAAETDDLLRHARAKLRAKGCDWIVANHARALEQQDNEITLITAASAAHWPKMSKARVATRLTQHICEVLC